MYTKEGNLGKDYCGVVLKIFGIQIPLVIRNCIFNEACKWHDYQYNNCIDFKNVGTKEVDLGLLQRMLVIAGNNKPLKVQAYIMYFIVRQWGKMRWICAQFNIIW